MNSLLFDANLLRDLPGREKYKIDQNLIIRPLCRGDFQKGFFDLLQQLTTVGNSEEADFFRRFDEMKTCDNTYYVTVIEDLKNNFIVGTGSLIIEQKFIHNCSVRGRIEDVVVSSNYRGKELGKLLVEMLRDLAKKLGCYKVTLDCKDFMRPFYENLDFVREENNSNYLQKRFSN